MNKHLKNLLLMIPPVYKKYIIIQKLQKENINYKNEVIKLNNDIIKLNNEINLISNKLFFYSSLKNNDTFRWFYKNKTEFDSDINFKDFKNIVLEMNDEVIKSIYPFNISAYCDICKKNVKMRLNFNVGSISNGLNIAYSEDCVCSECNLGSRQRAIINYYENLNTHSYENDIYISESITPTFSYFKNNYKNVIGSEYLGNTKQSGEFYDYNGSLVRNEDLTSLSFPNESMDVIITQHVFEHIPDYNKSFCECFKVLRKKGALLFTIPFYEHNEKTIIRAVINDDGSITNIHPPEIHGNPVNSEGSLCFQRFGWDILDNLKSCGFINVFANFYWNRCKGYIGGPYIVFSAFKE